MNYFDIFLLLILTWSTFTAFLRGLLRELFSLIGLIVSITLAGFYYPRVAALLARWITSAPTANIVAFLGILVLVIVLFALIGKLLQSTASAIGLGFFDRLLGAVFGLARGCLFGVAIMMSVAAFFPTATWVAQSCLAPYLLRGAHVVSFVVPRDLRRQVRTGAETLLEASQSGSAL